MILWQWTSGRSSSAFFSLTLLSIKCERVTGQATRNTQNTLIKKKKNQKKPAKKARIIERHFKHQLEFNNWMQNYSCSKLCSITHLSSHRVAKDFVAAGLFSAHSVIVICYPPKPTAKLRHRHRKWALWNQSCEKNHWKCYRMKGLTYALNKKQTLNILFLWVQAFPSLSSLSEARSHHEAAPPLQAACKLFLISHNEHPRGSGAGNQTWGQHLRGVKAAILLRTLPAHWDKHSSTFQRANQFPASSNSQDIDLHLFQTRAKWTIRYLGAAHGSGGSVRSGCLIKQCKPVLSVFPAHCPY